MPHNVGKKLIEAIGKQLEKIEYFSSVENVSPNLAVHELRKVFKRLRALLRFYSDYPVDFPPDFHKQLAYFGRSISEIRESYINLQVFERICSGDLMVPERKLKVYKDFLTEKNKNLIDKGYFEVELYLPFLNYGKLLNGKLDQFDLSQPSVIQVVNQLENTYSDAFVINEQIWEGSDPVLIHELRKKLKRLMYQFEFVRYMHPRFFRGKTFQLNNITDQLGEDHDLFVFLEDMKKDQHGFETEELEIIENKIQHLREINHVKLFPRLKHFFADPPDSFNSKLESLFKLNQ
jgi:CHAD domain-containing protein